MCSHICRYEHYVFEDIGANMAQFTTILGVLNTSGVWDDLMQTEKNSLQKILLVCNYVTNSMVWSMMQSLIREDVRAGVMVRTQTQKNTL